MPEPAIYIEHLTHRYGTHTALQDVSLQVEPGAVFGLLGPNGGGKTTLFRVLSSLLHPSSGRASVFGFDTVREAADVRRRLGFVFQEPALDQTLTIAENLQFHGALYGLSGASLRARIDELLERFGLAGRATERVQTLSGGLTRRVDLARGLLHAPSLLLLDEPTNGLDPGARRSFWETLEVLRRDEGATLVVATHLMQEAERCDRVGIIDRGRIVALDAPDVLTRELGARMLWIETPDPADLRDRIQAQFGLEAHAVGTHVQLSPPDAPEVMASLYEAFGDRIESSAIRRPSLEDVFLTRTGYRLNAAVPAHAL